MKYVADSLIAAALACLLSTASGCVPLLQTAMDRPVRKGVEPQREGQYYIYKPSNYDRDLVWPLVIVCHSSFPDSARAQIGNWTDLAESRGFVVVAPKLKSVRATLSNSAERHIERMREDEEHILATVQRVRGAYNISDDRVFIHGWSVGGPVALTTGLKHPEVFRAVSLLQPRFVPALMADVDHKVDPAQPVFVDYSGIDVITGRNADACVEWLRENGANLREHSIGPARAGNTDRAVTFYEQVIRSNARMHVKAYAGRDGNPLSVRLVLESAVKPTRYRWTFGDGDVSPVAEPLHVFPSEGIYSVSVEILTEDGRRAARHYDLTLPGPKLQPVRGDAS